VRDALVVTMASLSPRRREVLAMAAMGGLAPIAIAQALGIPLDFVDVVLEDAVTQVVSRLVA
jgi:DNA-directed RNA polymerase specialized sigma24 family protein